MARRYDMTNRLIKKAAADLKRTLQDLEEVSATLTRREGRPRKERRKARRLEMLPSSMRCPRCGEVKLNSRQWVVTDGAPCCKACWMKRGVT